MRDAGARNRRRIPASAIRAYTENPIRQGRLDNPWEGVLYLAVWHAGCGLSEVYGKIPGLKYQC